MKHGRPWCATHARAAHRLLCVGLLIGVRASTTWAHQIDEFVSVTHVEIQRDHMRIFMSLTPGLELAPSVRAAIDTNGDGQFSGDEQRHYAEPFLRDTSVAIDAATLTLQLVEVRYPAPDELASGQALIRLTMDAVMPALPPGPHAVVVSNASQTSTVFVANALVSPDPRVSIGKQHRDRYQRRLEIDFAVAPRRVARWIVAGVLALAAAGVFVVRRRRRSVTAASTEQ